MKLTLEVSGAYLYNNNQLEIDVIYIAEGMLNIIVDGGAPDEIEIEIIKENAKLIQEAMAWELQEKELFTWESREKAWDIIRDGS